MPHLSHPTPTPKYKQSSPNVASSCIAPSASQTTHLSPGHFFPNAYEEPKKQGRQGSARAGTQKQLAQRKMG